MSLIVDGHNLIPKIPGVNLADPDDEMKLIKILQDYGRLRRKSIEVYFDKAEPSGSGKQQFGRVVAYFIQQGITADQVIMARLKKLGRRAKNVTVVSSDRQVRKAAQAAHTKLMTCEEFSADWQALLAEEPELDPRSRLLSSDEVDMWEDIFRRGHPPSREKK